MQRFDKDKQLNILQKAIDQTSISIIITDVNGNITYVNNSFTLMSGYNEDEVIGKNSRFLKSGYHDQKFYENLWETILSGQTWKGEFKNKHKDGGFYWESTIISPIFDDSGIISHFLCTKEDVTDKKQAEKALFASESKLRSFFAQSNAIILVVDPNTIRIVEFNKAAELYYGYSLEEFSAIDFSTDFVGFVEAVKIEAFETQGDNKNVYVQKHKLKNGEYRDVEIFPAKVEFNDNVLIYIIVQDITRRKKAIEALKESESKKLALLKIMPDLIFVMNTKGEFIDVYTDKPDRIGISPHKILGKTCEYVFPKELAEKIRQNILEAVETREVKSFEYRFKKDFRRYVFEEIRIISSGNDEVLVIMRDNTQEKNAQLNLEKAMEDANEANRIKSVFLANISHEIRTPINSILGFSDLLAAELHEPSQRLNLQSIKSSSKSLLNLINDILDLSKIEAGKLTIKYHELNPRVLLNELENLFSIKVNEKGLTYNTLVEKNVPDIVVFDEMRLKQILINLIGNSIKFTDRGYVSVRLSTHNFTKVDGEEFVDLVFEVEDTGIGIKEENQKVIFEAFKQQDDQDARKYGGTGLGLAITKSLIRMLNGSIALDSVVNKGSIFTVVFSGVEISTNLSMVSRARITPRGKRRIGQVVFKPAVVLIADDDKPNREILKGIFKGSNMDFQLAENGKHAIKLIKNKKPKIALVDIKMPLIDGLELAEYIKTNEQLKDVIVIGVSATPIIPGKDKRSEYLDDFIAKPIDINKFLEKLERYLPIVDDSKTLGLRSDMENKGEFALDKELAAKFKLFREQKIIPAMHRMSNTSSFSDYEKFGKILIEIGGELGINTLTYIGTAIEQAVKTFDLESLAKIIADYKLVEKELLIGKDE